MNENICSRCGKDKMAGECACPLNQEELKDLNDLNIIMKVIQIKNLKDQINISNVVATLDIGDVLVRMKENFPYGSWLPFVRSQMGFSARTCQNFMRLSKSGIHEKYYRLGTQELVTRLESGVDLSV